MIRDILTEACGIFGVFGVKNASYLTYQGLYALQHRGQESAGIATCHEGQMHFYRGMGLVSEVFKRFDFTRLRGDLAIGHNRYSTTGMSSITNAQPLCMECRIGMIAIAHNGNLINATKVRKELQDQGAIFQTATDSEVIVHLISRGRERTLEKAMKKALSQVSGAYCITAMAPGCLIAARDPHGFRPLALGSLDGGYVVASESCAFDLIGAEFVREIEPGEILTITKEGMRSTYLPKSGNGHAKCIFEYIYFSRPDSTIFGENCDKIRREMGRQLAREAKAEGAQLIISVPDSSNTAALGYSEESGIPFEIGLIRNHYVGRTFIKPDQDSRSLSVRLKFNPVKGVLKGKRIVVVEDSLVRGTTLKELVKLIRAAGAAEIHIRVASPPIKKPCFFGIDLSTKEELIAHRLDVDGIRDYVGADSLSYLSLEGLLSVSPGKQNGYCVGCFGGEYPIKPPRQFSKDQLEQQKKLQVT